MKAKRKPRSNRVDSNDGLEFISVGEYKIFLLPSGNYWILHSSGEGMETRKELFEDFIHTFYVQEF